MSQHFLYSTNTFLKHLINQRYRRDIHYVWCSEDFDSTTVSSYSSGALVPPSSNPANIYRELKEDVHRGDMHSAKIQAQRASLTKLAIQWEQKGEMDRQQKVDLIFMVKNAPIIHWRPLVYVIHRLDVDHRLQPVPMNKTAGLGVEYIVADLQRSEFDVIEI